MSLGTEPLQQRAILDHDVAGDPAEQGGARPDQDRIAIEQRHQQRAAGDDQRDAGGETEDDQGRLDDGRVRQIDAQRRQSRPPPQWRSRCRGS